MTYELADQLKIPVTPARCVDEMTLVETFDLIVFYHQRAREMQRQMDEARNESGSGSGDYADVME